MCKLEEGPVSIVNVKTGYIHTHTHTVRSSLPQKFVFTCWEVVITTPGADKSLWSARDGGATSEQGF